jgi:transketolase
VPAPLRGSARRLQESGARHKRARVAVEAAVEFDWERYIGLEGRFVGMHDFGTSGKIADVYKKFDINVEAVVRAAHETLAAVAAL